MDVQDAERVTRIRQSAAQLRRLDRDGGFTAATINAIKRHRQTFDREIALLVDAGHRELVGLLGEERRLADRIRHRKSLEAGHEDLDARLTVCRDRIRVLVGA
ncbi:MAG: hypothetical protein ACREQ5_00890 [Candidatus Dormibacteria bacterium]